MGAYTMHANLMAIFATLVFSVPTAQATTSGPPTKYIRDLTNAEDLVSLQGTPWVVVSHRAAHNEHGPIDAIRKDSGKVSRLFPGDRQRDKWDRQLYPDCSAPPSRLSSHGLNVRRVGIDRFRLYVVNHGERESVEIIDVESRGEQLVPEWRGCVRAPEGVRPNAVAPLPGDGLVLSGGSVAIWQPTRGWRTVENVRGANGIEASRDGRTLFVALSFDKAVLRTSVVGTESRKIVRLAFLPDNLRWGADGYLYVAGINETSGLPDVIAQCHQAPVCDLGFTIAQLDPETLSAQELFTTDGIKGVFGAATTALQVGRHLWLGTFSGDRVAILSLTE